MFYSILTLEDNKPALSTISKLIEDPNENRFIGITQLICPLEKFTKEQDLTLNTKVYLLDSGKVIIDLINNSCFEIKNPSEELKNIERNFYFRRK